MVPGSLAELHQRTPGSVPQRAGGEHEGLHFVHRGNSQAHGGFVVATADAAFAEFGAVAAVVAVSFVAAAHAVSVAAVAVDARAVDVEGFVVAAAFVAGLYAVAVVFVLACAAAVSDVGVLHLVPSSLVGSVELFCSPGRSGSRGADAA